MLTADKPLQSHEFRRALRYGPYAWPGGYPKYFIAADGEALCFKCAKAEKRLISHAILSKETFSSWRVFFVDVNWEDSSLFCSHCSNRIESAYAE